MSNERIKLQIHLQEMCYIYFNDKITIKIKKKRINKIILK